MARVIFKNVSALKRKEDHLRYENASKFYTTVVAASVVSNDSIQVETDDGNIRVLYGSLLPDSGAPELETVAIHDNPTRETSNTVLYMHLDAAKKQITIAPNWDNLYSGDPLITIADVGGFKSKDVNRPDLLTDWLAVLGYGANSFTVFEV